MTTQYWKQIWQVIVIVLLVGWPGVARAQQGSVSGTVIDTSGAVVAGATVNLINLASNVIRTAVTDPNGKFEITGLPSGQYRLVVKATGYNNYGRTIAVTGEPVVQNVVLAPGSIMEEITVTAARGLAGEQDIPLNVTTITSESIEARLPTSVGEALKATPSLFIFNPGPVLGSPNLRGLQSSRVLIVVDGERVNNSRTEIQTFGPSVGAFIETFQIDTAEVVAGAGSSLYGTDSLVGTVNFTTKIPTRPDKGWILGTRFQGLYSQNENGRKGNVTLNLSNPWIAINLSGSLYRYGYYHFGSTGGVVPLAAVMQQQDFLKFLSNSTDNRMDFELSQEWNRRFTNLGVPANATQTTVFGTQAHGATGFFNLFLHPHQNHYIRYKQMNTHLGPYGYPGEAVPWHPEYFFASFDRVDRYGVRYQGVELSPLITRVAGGFYRQYLYRAGDSLTFFRTNRLAPGSTATLDTYVRPSALTFSKQGVVTTGFDGQATLQLTLANMLLVGYQFWRDRSADEFQQWFYNAQRGGAGRVLLPWSPLDGFLLSGAGNFGKGVPDGYTQESAFFLQDQLDAFRWLRLEGTFRYSRFTTQFRPSEGFPLPGFNIAINGPFPAGIDPNGAVPFAPVINRTGNISFKRNVYTGSFAIIGRPHGTVSVFGRIGNSFRQPALVEMGLFRGFPFGTFGFIFLPNGNLKPERGVNVDTGVKVSNRFFRAAATYFNNTYTNFIEQTPPLFQPGGPGSLAERLGFQFLLWVQRLNTGRARVHGLETEFEVPLQIQDRAILTVAGTMSWEHGRDLRPTPGQFAFLERQFQANERAGKKLFDFGRRSLDANGRPVFSDVPFERVIPFMASWNVRLADKRNRFWTEYDARAHTRVRRLDPDIQPNFLRLNYFGWAGLAGKTVHNWRVGYTHHSEHYKTSFALSVDNVGNKFYTDPFQRAPARGRSVILGVVIESFDLLRYLR